MLATFHARVLMWIHCISYLRNFLKKNLLTVTTFRFSLWCLYKHKMRTSSSQSCLLIFWQVKVPAKRQLDLCVGCCWIPTRGLDSLKFISFQIYLFPSFLYLLVEVLDVQTVYLHSSLDIHDVYPYLTFDLQTVHACLSFDIHSVYLWLYQFCLYMFIHLYSCCSLIFIL